jgi:hypothetical protein
MACHEDISSVWHARGEAKEEAAEHEAEVAELRAEFDAVRASKAPPGSRDDMENAKAHWLLLLSAAQTVLAACEKAGVLHGREAHGLIQ